MAAAVVQHAAESELFVAGERARRRQASDATVSSSGLGRAWEAVEPGCSSAIAGGLKTGSGPYAGHPLMKRESRAKIFLPLSGLSSLKFQNQTQKNSTKEFRLSCSQSI